MSPAHHDRYIYNQTNIDGHRQDASANIFMDHHKSKESLIKHSPSPKKWAGKLLNFQLHSKKNKNGTSVTPVVSSPISAITPVTSSPIVSEHTFNSPYTPTGNITPTSTYPSRVSSLPRPISRISSRGNINASAPCISDSNQGIFPTEYLPKEPLKSSGSNKRSFLNDNCTICDEPTSHRSHGERIIELQCGHLCHQYCLLISFEDVATYSTNIYELFPPCLRCKTEKSVDINCVPKDDTLKDKIISDIFMTKVGSVSTPTTPYINTPTNHVTPTPINGNEQPITRPTLNIGTALGLNRTRRDLSPPFSQQTYQLSMPFQYSSVNTIPTNPVTNFENQTSIRDDISNMSTIEDHDQPVRNSSISVPLLRTYFLDLIINRFESTISKELVDSEFGLLRIVDRMSISIDTPNFLPCWSLLFMNCLVIVYTDPAQDQSDENIMLNTNFNNIHMFYPLEHVSVEPLSDTSLQCAIITDSISKHFCLAESTTHGFSKVSQKWASALLNKKLVFNEETFTSTLPLPPIIKNITNDGDVLATYSGNGSNQKVTELGTISHMRGSVIIRRMSALPRNANNGGTMMSISTNKTSISSIISMRRKKPDNLIVIIQIDKRYVISEDIYSTIYNNLKALEILFPSLYICLVDSKMSLVRQGPASEIIKTPEDLKISTPICSFNSKLLRETVLNVTISSSRTVGIALISNTMMNKESCILFQQIALLRKMGELRANILKIKVGYLNMNYTDQIDELVEIDNWTDMLELLCYTFAIDYDSEDDNSDISDFDDIVSLTSSGDRHSIESSDHSLLTLHITSSLFDTDNHVIIT
ncbi:similar to Saccharomyces cerevisiae YDR103W STE5 Pheromone-response scaffold protein that controls the mating decision [Maudiozyma saulgeensis]|uniref:Similar to Saccharomyces cerevisiae YDR103W STE5 Pheromone-response scaffold protein that controls the mating decision n=1 Tax=Maudiozyma saulgeensis TaxID=1789683 RepID=A0A1X7R6A5_9SACH|nr:similar to Saccharomyces cerevisiae YDR103W STE5 Pheromone-response scaffold protein that controls the mating decision [Kazachstania saulgeensis]